MPKKINLALIIEGCRTQNPKCQKLLYEQYFGYGMNICLRYSKNREEAEEILHNSFLKVFNGLDSFKSDLEFRPWLRRVLINTSIDYYRAEHKHHHLSIEDMEEVGSEEMSYPVISPSEDMLPLVQKLTPAYRMVFNLFVMEGYKHREIAELLSISVPTSKSNLSRAKVKLKALYFKQNKKSEKRIIS